MNIDAIKKITMEALGTKELADVDYITEELINDYFMNEGDSVAKGEGKSELLEEHALAGCSWGTYGNSLVHTKTHVHYKQNEKGSKNYGCGSAKNMKWKKDTGDYFKQMGKCSNGKMEYLLCCPSC